MKSLILKLLITLSLISSFVPYGFSAQRVFHEDCENTTFSEHFLENQFGTSYEGYWDEFISEVHRDTSIAYDGNTSFRWNPPTDGNSHANIGMGDVTYGNTNNIDFEQYANRYWYFRWYQSWENAAYSGANKIFYLGCGGDYYYLSKSSNGNSFIYMIRDEFGGNILDHGYPSHSSNLDDNEWHKIEIYIDFGTSGNSDGETWVEIDDEQLFNSTGLAFVTHPTPVGCLSIPGNVGRAEEVSGSQNVWYDEIEVYTLNGPEDIPEQNATGLASPTDLSVNAQE